MVYMVFLKVQIALGGKIAERKHVRHVGKQLIETYRRETQTLQEAPR